jgi:hypothetical protein
MATLAIRALQFSFFCQVFMGGGLWSRFGVLSIAVNPRWEPIPVNPQNGEIRTPLFLQISPKAINLRSRGPGTTIGPQRGVRLAGTRVNICLMEPDRACPRRRCSGGKSGGISAPANKPILPNIYKFFADSLCHCYCPIAHHMVGSMNQKTDKNGNF